MNLLRKYYDKDSIGGGIPDEVNLKSKVKRWVVLNSGVTNPYKRKLWYASVTIGYDYNGQGLSIEAAYNDLTEKIFNSAYILNQLIKYKSFINLTN